MLFANVKKQVPPDPPENIQQLEAKVTALEKKVDDQMWELEICKGINEDISNRLAKFEGSTRK